MNLEIALFRSRKTDDELTFADEFKNVRRSSTKTAFWVVLLMSGVTPAFCLLTGIGHNAVTWTDQLKTIATVMLHTYPFTLAVAIITMSRRQKWLRWGKWFLAATVVVLCAGLGNSIGELTGVGAVQPASVFDDHGNPLFGIPAAGINYLVGFYQAYGARTFFASLIIGIYAGTTASRLLPHVPKSRNEVIRLAAELAESRRRAA